LREPFLVMAMPDYVKLLEKSDQIFIMFE